METHLLKQPTIIYVAIQIKPTEELCGITMTEAVSEMIQANIMATLLRKPSV